MHQEVPQSFNDRKLMTVQLFPTGTDVTVESINSFSNGSFVHKEGELSIKMLFSECPESIWRTQYWSQFYLH